MKIGAGTKLWHRRLSNIGDCVIGDNCIIHSHVWIGNGVEIGDRCKVQAFAFIPSGVCIGNDVFIGPHVCFTNDKNPPSRTPSKWQNTTVEDFVSVGAGAVILPGVTLKRGCKIGAGAVVVCDVEENVTVVGNPAKPLIKVRR